MNPYFGRPWDAIWCDPAEGARQVSTPVGELCTSCQTPILDGDQGIVMIHVSSDEQGQLVGRILPQHRECLLYSTSAHTFKFCRCCNDDPERPRTPAERREQALALWEHMRTLRIAQGVIGEW